MQKNTFKVEGKAFENLREKKCVNASKEMPKRILQTSNSRDYKPQRLQPCLKRNYKAHRVTDGNTSNTKFKTVNQPKRAEKSADKFAGSMSRREQLERWRAEKGLTKKENCHPLLSRKRPLSKVVASPSYKPVTECKTKKIRRHTLAPQVKNIQLQNLVHKKERRQTMPCHGTKFKQNHVTQTPDAINTIKNTPWANKTLSMLKTPHITPYVKKTKSSYKKSPIHSDATSKDKLLFTPITKICGNKQTDDTTPEDLNGTFTFGDNDGNEDANKLSNETIQKLLKDLLEENKDNDVIETSLDDLIHKCPDIVKYSNYWICRARLAAHENDVQRVVCLLEQAYTFNAKPEENIKMEICRFLERIEDDDEERDDIFEDCVTKYTITPGRRVHFAVDTLSPVQFKSSIIRFCIVESKAFKKRLNAQIKRKIMTPVRRSARLQKADLPNYLRPNRRFVDSPSEVENEIIAGKIQFAPNLTINTPLNNGWIIKDERLKGQNDTMEECNLNLSFM